MRRRRNLPEFTEEEIDPDFSPKKKITDKPSAEVDPSLLNRSGRRVSPRTIAGAVRPRAPTHQVGPFVQLLKKGPGAFIWVCATFLEGKIWDRILRLLPARYQCIIAQNWPGFKERAISAITWRALSMNYLFEEGWQTEHRLFHRFEDADPEGVQAYRKRELRCECNYHDGPTYDDNFATTVVHHHYKQEEPDELFSRVSTHGLVRSQVWGPFVMGRGATNRNRLLDAAGITDPLERFLSVPHSLSEVDNVIQLITELKEKGDERVTHPCFLNHFLLFLTTDWSYIKSNTYPAVQFIYDMGGRNKSVHISRVKKDAPKNGENVMESGWVVRSACCANKPRPTEPIWYEDMARSFCAPHIPPTSEPVSQDTEH